MRRGGAGRGGGGGGAGLAAEGSLVDGAGLVRVERGGAEAQARLGAVPLGQPLGPGVPRRGQPAQPGRGATPQQLHEDDGIAHLRGVV
jgi:hypothetical protein